MSDIEEELKRLLDDDSIKVIEVPVGDDRNFNGLNYQEYEALTERLSDTLKGLIARTDVKDDNQKHMIAMILAIALDGIVLRDKMKALEVDTEKLRAAVHVFVDEESDKLSD